jgi:hypothetical protein
MLFIFSTPVSIRHLWQVKTVVFQHKCLIRAHPLSDKLVRHGYTKKQVREGQDNLLGCESSEFYKTSGGIIS